MNNDTRKQTIEVSRRTALYIAGGVVVLIAALFIWKAIQLNGVQSDFEKKQAALLQQVQTDYMASQRASFKAMAKAYVWAVRKEMLSGNLEQMNQYGNEMVKEKNFVYIMVADPGGKILASTDKKYQDKNLGVLVKNPAVFNTDSMLVLAHADSVTEIAAPVMGLDKKLGIVYIKYDPIRFNMSNP
jgi:hypothetical protein